MSLRARIAAVAGLAVAVAVLLAAVVVYVAVRSDLRGQVDASLHQRAAGLLAPPAAPPEGVGALAAGANPAGAGEGAPAAGQNQAGAGAGTATAGGNQANAGAGTATAGGNQANAGAGTATAGGNQANAGAGTATAGGNQANAGAGTATAGGNQANAGAGHPSSRSGRPAGPPPRWPSAVAPARFGGPSGYVQFIGPTGAIDVPGGQGSSPTIAPDSAERAIAARGRGELLADRTVRGTHLRVLTLGTNPRGAVLVALPLTQVDHELHHILLVLVVVGVVGIALAALLGALVARTALAPIARFTRRTEQLTGDPDLTARLQVSGRDELARLAASFNDTLAELERSVAAQRHLIADASHELRTPIASLRANIQVLEDAARLAPEDREALRRDIVDELDELTALVSDVVELARGAGGEPATDDDVRLDQIVAEAVERTRRRSELRFQVELQPTLVRGTPERINRAVANLLDNARKWSPSGGFVEVELRDGILTVRDHGPGFRDSDLPHVFDRFYRAESARGLPGSGLGLAIVRQAAETHNGYVQAENAPGGGARLLVSFGAPLRVPSSLAM